MALTTATITGDIADQLGNDFDIRRTKIWLTTNVPGQTIIDSAGDKIRLGSGNVTLGADGTFSAVVWVPGAGSNPASWQTTIHVDYPDRNTTTGRAVKSFGPFTVTTNANLADLVAEMPVQPEYLATVLETVQDMIDAATDGTGPALTALADRLDGVNDHGNVSGTLTLDPANGFHVFDATGPLEISLGDPPGYSVAFKAITGADDVTIDGLDDLELTDDAWATFVHYRSSWHLAASGASGGGDVEPVLDPPTQPGAVTVDPTADGYNLSWVASTVAAGYEVQIDGGAWVDSGANLTHAYTGLTAGSSHSGAVRAYNSGGERSDARSWGPASTDTLGLHEQILSYDPSYYLRLSQGSIQDYSATPKTWTPTAGNTAPVFDGPALAPGDVSSARWPSNSQLSASGIDFGGMGSFTLVALVRSPDVAPGAYGNMGMADVNIGWEFESYSRYKPNETHIVFIEWDVSYGGNGRYYFDTDTSFSNANINRSGTTTADVAQIYAHGNEFGAGSNGGFASYLAILPNVLLDASQRLAMATAAGRA